MPKFNLRCVGHEMVVRKSSAEKGTIEETEMLVVKFRGIDGDAKSRMSIEVDPNLIDEYPLTEAAELSIRFPQTTLALAGKKAKAIES